tara:strand:- start:1761 stop:1988 length:228 start_codon:yes stop_codon:yes gene_type:complete
MASTKLTIALEMQTELNSIKEKKQKVEDQVKKGGNSIDTQEKLLELYRELTTREINIKKQLQKNYVNTLYDTLFD